MAKLQCAKSGGGWSLDELSTLKREFTIGFEGWSPMPVGLGRL